MKPGNIILLNGTSSSGKTTIARLLQQRMEEPYLHLGNDQFLGPNRPARLLAYTEEAGPVEVEGWLALFQEGRFVDLRVGPVALRWLAGMFRAMAAWSETGNHLIGDVVLHDPRIVRAAVEALHHLPVWLISVSLPLAVAEQREREREEKRAPGGARVFYHGVHSLGVADLVVDTARDTPEACVQQIARHVLAGDPPHAVRDLYRRLGAQPDP